MTTPPEPVQETEPTSAFPNDESGTWPEKYADLMLYAEGIAAERDAALKKLAALAEPVQEDDEPERRVSDLNAEPDLVESARDWNVSFADDLEDQGELRDNITGLISMLADEIERLRRREVVESNTDPSPIAWEVRDANGDLVFVAATQEEATDALSAKAVGYTVHAVMPAGWLPGGGQT